MRTKKSKSPPQRQGRGVPAPDEWREPTSVGEFMRRAEAREKVCIPEAQYIALADLIRTRIAISVLGEVHRRAKVRRILKTLFALEIEMTRALCPDWA